MFRASSGIAQFATPFYDPSWGGEKIPLAREQRRLAAIVAADVVGYSRLMGRDESGTLARLREHRKQRFEPTLARHGGRLVKLTGDGALAEFPSAVDALSAAIEFQQAMADVNAGQPEDMAIVFRIGLHLGDLIVDGDDLYGDGVNVAARLEAEAPPGGIIVSRAVREAVQGRLEATLHALGELALKNIDRPIRAFRVEWSEADWRGQATPAVKLPEPVALTAPALTLPDKPSIAVLPFQNMSGDPEQDYFADGIVEDIITALSQIKSLFVIARNSSFSYKGKSPDIRQVGRELGVRYVLEGSVRKVGSRVRITGQLIEAENSAHIWADRYDRELDNIFSMQDDITRNIVGAIDPGIMMAEAQRVQRKDPGRLDAWDCTVRAHWHIRRFTSADSALAIELLEQAREHDPGNAAALGHLAMAHHYQAVFGWSASPPASHAAMGEAARSAVLVDNQDAFAHTALAIFELFSCHHDEAVRRLERAIALNSNLAFARGYLGVALAFTGEDAAAFRHLDEAIRYSPRDPLLCVWHVGKAWASLAAGRFPEAIEHVRNGIENNPEFVDLYGVMAAAHGHLGEATPAAAALEQYQKRIPGLIRNDPRLERPFKRPEDRERFMGGLVKAGLAG